MTALDIFATTRAPQTRIVLGLCKRALEMLPVLVDVADVRALSEDEPGTASQRAGGDRRHLRGEEIRHTL